MKTRRPRGPMQRTRLLVFLLVAAVAVPAWAAESLSTRFTLLAGFPESDTAADGVLVVPGMVIPLRSGPPSQPSPEAALSVSELADSLVRTLRLEDVEVLYRYPVSLYPSGHVALPPPSAASSIRLAANVLGFNDQGATYNIRIRDGVEVLADTSVNVARGERAVVGALGGAEAPYLFLVIEPRPRDSSPANLQPVHIAGVGEVTPPRALHRPPPAYTEQAREERIQGVVVLQTVIDSKGDVRDIEVLKGLPGGLSEAAVGAVSQWRFAPATDADGKPIDVYYNLTVNFRLAKDKTPEDQ